MKLSPLDRLVRALTTLSLEMQFASYLEATFPVLHQKMALAKVNTHGLVFTWTGSDSKLKPLLLMGTDHLHLWSYIY